jgi:hypothetical protein
MNRELRDLRDIFADYFWSGLVRVAKICGWLTGFSVLMAAVSIVIFAASFLMRLIFGW